jgi:hypothetical protein
MADVPRAPIEGTSDESTEQRVMLSLTEDDGGGGLRFALLKSFVSTLVNGKWLGITSQGIEDGNDANAGITTASAIITDASGTLSGKLRGVVKFLFERMPASLGQKAKSASLPVVISSDQWFPNTITRNWYDVPSDGTTVMSENEQRVYALLTNSSDEVIYLSFAAWANMNEGMRLEPGETYKIHRKKMWKGYVSAVCSSGNKRLVVVEALLI